MRNLQGYYFYVNLNIWGNFQICISVPLSNCFVYTGKMGKSVCSKVTLKEEIIELYHNDV